MYELSPEQAAEVSGAFKCQTGCSVLKAWVYQMSYETATIIGAGTYAEGSAIATGAPASGNLGYLADGADNAFEEDLELADGW